MGRAPCCDKVGLKKGPWTPEEDQKLMAYIKDHGHGSWRALPQKAGLLRCGKSCRLRWANYLRPDIKRGKFSLQEEQTIIQLHALLGNRWSAIATHLPMRTDNEIKNYWNTHLKKRLSQMGIDPVTHKPKSDSLNVPDGQSNGSSSSTLSHMAQWESARLEAESRLARESKLRANGLWPMAESRPAGFCSSSDVFAKAWKSSASGLDCSSSSGLFSAPGGSLDLMRLLQKWDKTGDSASSLFGPSFKVDHCSSPAMQLADSFTYTLETQTQAQAEGQSSDVGGAGFVGLLHQAMGPPAKLSQKAQPLIRKNQQCNLYNMESEDNNSLELKPTMLLENGRSIGDGSDLIQSSCSHEETVQKAADSALLLPGGVQFNDERNCSSARSDDSELVSKAEEEHGCSPKPGTSDQDNVLGEFHLLNDEISSSGDFKSGTGGYDGFSCTDMLLDLVEPPSGDDDHMQPTGSVSACNEDRSLNGLCMEAGENKDYWSNIFNMVNSPRSCSHGGVPMNNIF